MEKRLTQQNPINVALETEIGSVQERQMHLLKFPSDTVERFIPGQPCRHLSVPCLYLQIAVEFTGFKFITFTLSHHAFVLIIMGTPSLQHVKNMNLKPTYLIDRVYQTTTSVFTWSKFLIVSILKYELCYLRKKHYPKICPQSTIICGSSKRCVSHVGR